MTYCDMMLLLREDRRAERALAQRRCIEHTPVYEDDQQQCSKPLSHNLHKL